MHVVALVWREPSKSGGAGSVEVVDERTIGLYAGGWVRIDQFGTAGRIGVDVVEPDERVVKVVVCARGGSGASRRCRIALEVPFPGHVFRLERVNKIAG